MESYGTLCDAFYCPNWRNLSFWYRVHQQKGGFFGELLLWAVESNEWIHAMHQWTIENLLEFVSWSKWCLQRNYFAFKQFKRLSNALPLTVIQFRKIIA